MLVDKYVIEYGNKVLNQLGLEEFEIEKLLGVGSYGFVFKAHKKGDAAGIPYTVKIIEVDLFSPVRSINEKEFLKQHYTAVKSCCPACIINSYPQYIREAIIDTPLKRVYYLALVNDFVPYTLRNAEIKDLSLEKKIKLILNLGECLKGLTSKGLLYINLKPSNIGLAELSINPILLDLEGLITPDEEFLKNSIIFNNLKFSFSPRYTADELLNILENGSFDELKDFIKREAEEKKALTYSLAAIFLDLLSPHGYFFRIEQILRSIGDKTLRKLLEKSLDERRFRPPLDKFLKELEKFYASRILTAKDQENVSAKILTGILSPFRKKEEEEERETVAQTEEGELKSVIETIKKIAFMEIKLPGGKKKKEETKKVEPKIKSAEERKHKTLSHLAAEFRRLAEGKKGEKQPRERKETKSSDVVREIREKLLGNKHKGAETPPAPPKREAEKPREEESHGKSSLEIKPEMGELRELTIGEGQVLILENNTYTVFGELVVEKGELIVKNATLKFTPGSSISVRDGKFIAENSTFEPQEEGTYWRNISLVGEIEGYIKSCRFKNGKGRSGELLTYLGLEVEDKKTFGGAIFIWNEGEEPFTVEKSAFENCSASFGGAIYSNGPVVIIEDRFIDCSAKEDGGAIYLQEKGVLRACNFERCSAEQNGGGLYALKLATITVCKFEECKAVESGGGAYLAETSQMNACDFSDCSASNGGGAYIIDSNNLKFCNFLRCFAEDNGGGVYTVNNNIVDSCTFDKCSAAYGGCVYAGEVFGGNNVITNCKFNHCSAKTGGCIYTWSETNRCEGNTFIDCQPNKIDGEDENCTG